MLNEKNIERKKEEKNLKEIVCEKKEKKVSI